MSYEDYNPWCAENFNCADCVHRFGCDHPDNYIKYLRN